MAIDADLIRDLRERTGAGLADCKKALEEAGNIDDAIKYLREKGINSAAKKADREVKEGACGIIFDNNSASVIKLACETDFVARNDKFHATINKFLQDLHAEKCDSLDVAKAKKSDDLSEQIGLIGENMSIAGFGRLSVSNGVIASYVHTSYSNNIGKKLCALAIESDVSNKEALLEMGKKICMHITAMKPEFISIDDISEDFKKSEKEIYISQMKDSGKKPEILEKIIEGKLQKTFAEKTLLEQDFCMDPSIKVRELIEKTAKELGGSIKLVKFISFEI